MSVKQEDETIRSGLMARTHPMVVLPGRDQDSAAAVQALTVARPEELQHSCLRLLNWVSHIYKAVGELEPVQKSIKPVIKVKYSVAR